MVANETKQSQELAKRLWAIANDLRGNMNAAKFQNYILGVIFYRYLSEHTENYMDDLLKNDGISYQEALADPDYTETVKAVSYTHLDVYKRQSWGFPCLPITPCGGVTTSPRTRLINSVNCCNAK